LTTVSVVLTVVEIAPTIVFGGEKMFSSIETIFLRAETVVEVPETMFSAVETLVLTIKAMVFLVETTVGVTRTLFSEAEPIFCASQTGFSIAEKTVGDISRCPFWNREGRKDLKVSKFLKTFAGFEVLAVQFCRFLQKV